MTNIAQNRKFGARMRVTLLAFLCCHGLRAPPSRLATSLPPTVKRTHKRQVKSRGCSSAIPKSIVTT